MRSRNRLTRATGHCSLQQYLRTRASSSIACRRRWVSAAVPAPSATGSPVADPAHSRARRQGHPARSRFQPHHYRRVIFPARLAGRIPPWITASGRSSLPALSFARSASRGFLTLLSYSARPGDCLRRHPSGVDGQSGSGRYHLPHLAIWYPRNHLPAWFRSRAHRYVAGRSSPHHAQLRHRRLGAGGRSRSPTSYP